MEIVTNNKVWIRSLGNVISLLKQRRKTVKSKFMQSLVARIAWDCGKLAKISPLMVGTVTVRLRLLGHLIKFVSSGKL